MTKNLRLVVFWIVVFVLGLVVAACAAAPTPTATTKPAAATPTPEAIRFEGGKQLPLADGFPNRPINIVTTKAGSSSDVDTRTLVNAVEKFSPVPITIINDGEGHDTAFVYARGQVGFDDGYYLGSASGSMMPYYYTRATGVGPTDYKVVILEATSPIFLAVKADAPWKTFKEFVDYAKANPGKARIISGGSGNWNHVIAGWIPKEAGFQATVLTEESSGAAAKVLLGGGVEAAVISIPTFRPQLEAGKLIALGTVEGKRLPDLPNIPTFKEMGYNIDYSHFRGVIASNKVSDKRLEWLFTLFKRSADVPEYVEYNKKGAQYSMGLGGKQAMDYLLSLDKVAAEVTLMLGMRTQK